MVPVAQTLIGGIGWRHAFIALALVAALLAPLALLLRDRPTQAAGAAGPDQSIGEAVREAFAHRGFWLLNAGFFACGFQLAFIATHLPAYLLDHGLPARHASVALALIALTNVAGTYACGHLGGCCGASTCCRCCTSCGRSRWPRSSRHRCRPRASTCSRP